MSQLLYAKKQPLLITYSGHDFHLLIEFTRLYRANEMRKIFLLAFFLLITGCDNNPETTIDDRWYSKSQVNNGRIIYDKHCAECHGNNAQGTLEWKKTLADGSYPPPPLNGTAHAWHHPLSALESTINKGGIPLGGKMPAFDGKLSESETKEVIAFFQSHWKQEIYDAWIEIN